MTTTTVQLTSASVAELSSAFCQNQSVYNGLLSAAQTSPYLAGLINAFVAENGTFETPAGNAADTAPNGLTVYVGTSLFQSTTTTNGVTQTTGESPLVLATLLGHELGHALLPGGEGEVNGPATNPTQAAANGLANEGVAVVSEYIVATQLGLNGQGIIPQTMHSDPKNILTPQLNQLAQSEGLDVSTLTYGSAPTLAFVQPNTAATNAAASYYSQGAPSVAPQLTYQQYYADAWIINNCGTVPASAVNWEQVTESMFSVTNNPNGTCSINTAAIPLTSASGGGTAPAISGTLSAPAVNPDGSQTTTFASASGNTVLQFNVDGSVNGTLTNASGTTTETFQFGSNGNLVADTRYQNDGSQNVYAYNSDGSGTETIISATGQLTETVNFDANGYALNETINDFNTDGLGHILGSAGQTYVTFDGTGASHSVYTDTSGNQTVTDETASGVVTDQASYDNVGNLLSNDQYTYNPDGSHIDEGTDSLGHFVQTYSTNDPASLVESKSYAPSGYLQEDDQYDDVSFEPTSSTYYNSSGQLLRTIVFSFDSDYNETQAFYDGSGNRYEVIDTNNQTHYYDANGNEVGSLQQSCASAATQAFQDPLEFLSVSYQATLNATNAMIATINATFNQPNSAAGSILPTPPSISPFGIPTSPNGGMGSEDGVVTYPVPNPSVVTTPIDSQQVSTAPQVPTGENDSPPAPASANTPTYAAPTVVQPLTTQTVAAGAAWTYALPAGLFSESGAGDTLTYKVTLANGDPLPSWITFDPVEQTFSGTPTDQATGALGLQITTTDMGGLATSTSLNVQVNPVYAAPTASAPMVLMKTLGQPWTLPLALFNTAVAGDTLTYSAMMSDGSALPAWLTFDPVGQIFNGAPPGQAAATLNMAITATDMGGLSSSTTLTVQLQQNILTPPSSDVTAVPAGQIAIDESNAYTGITAAGGENHILVTTGDFGSASLGNGDNWVAMAGVYDNAALGDGNNVLQETGWNDTVTLGNGNNTISADNSASITAGNGNNTVTATGASESVTLGDGANNIAMSGSFDSVQAGNGNNVITANGAFETVQVGSGNNTIDAEGYFEFITLGDGTDTGMMSEDATVTVGHGTYTLENFGNLRFGADTASDHLWFQQVGSDLQITELGGGTVTAKNWYSAIPEQAFGIYAGDGESVSASGVNQLVQAMAAFAPPAPGATSFTAAEQQALTPVLAANWH